MAFWFASGLLVLLSTFECVCCSRCLVLVWVKLQCQLFIRLLQIIICTILLKSKNLIVVFAPAYSESKIHQQLGVSLLRVH